MFLICYCTWLSATLVVLMKVQCTDNMYNIHFNKFVYNGNIRSVYIILLNMDYRNDYIIALFL